LSTKKSLPLKEIWGKQSISAHDGHLH
jgi:hypothetical protein